MQWQFWIDRGGTFTDVVARDPQGVLHTAKLLSSDPERYADAAVEAIRRLTGADHRSLLPLSALAGGLFLLLADALSRTLFAPAELPVGVTTSLFGGPFFLILIRRSRGGRA